VNKVFVQLSGGLGNQMFQYATARALSLNNKSPLVVDTWSGFVRDRQYKRVFELGSFPINSRIANSWDRISLYLYRLQIKLGRTPRLLDRNQFGRDFYVEQDFQFEPLILDRPLTSSTWLIGYWQTFKYFVAYETLLRKELMPPAPTNGPFLALLELVTASESVAIGIRLYEESANPAAHARNRIIKTAVDVNRAIARLRARRPNAKFFIFCTHRAEYLATLDLPSDAVFVTADEGFSSTVECLWLLAQCKHHIFTNSTYYWWGAWLSEAVHKKEEQLIFAADNFINADGLCDHWQRF